MKENKHNPTKEKITQAPENLTRKTTIKVPVKTLGIINICKSSIGPYYEYITDLIVKEIHNKIVDNEDFNKRWKLSDTDISVEEYELKDKTRYLMAWHGNRYFYDNVNKYIVIISNNDINDVIIVDNPINTYYSGNHPSINPNLVFDINKYDYNTRNKLEVLFKEVLPRGYRLDDIFKFGNKTVFRINGGINLEDIINISKDLNIDYSSIQLQSNNKKNYDFDIIIDEIALKSCFDEEEFEDFSIII